MTDSDRPDRPPAGADRPSAGADRPSAGADDPSVDPDRRADGLAAVLRWAEYVREQPPEVWGPQQNRLVNGQLESARETGLSVDHERRVRAFADAESDRRRPGEDAGADGDARSDGADGDADAHGDADEG